MSGSSVDAPPKEGGHVPRGGRDVRASAPGFVPRRPVRGVAPSAGLSPAPAEERCGRGAEAGLGGLAVFRLLTPSHGHIGHIGADSFSV
jgi:hypothetical protein